MISDEPRHFYKFQFLQVRSSIIRLVFMLVACAPVLGVLSSAGRFVRWNVFRKKCPHRDMVEVVLNGVGHHGLWPY